MAVSVTINQAGKPAGVAGQSREDLDVGLAVSLSQSGGPFLAYQWTIRYVAIDVLTDTRSAAVLSAPTSATTSLSPIDKPGEYSGRLVVDSGAGLGASPDDVFDWTFYAGIPGDPIYGQPSAAGDELPRRAPGAGERGEHNAPDALDPGGNPDGWARTLEKWFALVRRLYLRQLFAVALVTWDGAGYVVTRQIGVSGATRVSTGVISVTFAGSFPDANYASGALAAGPSGGSAVVPVKGTNGCEVHRGDLAGSLVDASFILLVALRF